MWDTIHDTRVSLLHVSLAVVIGGVGFAIYWQKLAKRIHKEKKIQLTRIKNKDQHAAATMEEEVTQNPFLSALELDPERLKEPLFASVSMCSLGDYYRSLDAGDNGVSLEGVIAKMLEKAGMLALLPAIHHFSPASVKSATSLDDIAMNDFFTAMFSKLMSPLKIYSVTSALNEAASDAAEVGRKELIPEGVSAVEFYVAGEQPGLVPEFPESFRTKDTFLLKEDIAAIMATWGITQEDKLQPLAPSPGDVLPDLCTSFGGATMIQTPYEAGLSRIMSYVLNRLGANAVPSKYISLYTRTPVDRLPFTLFLTAAAKAAGTGAITTPEDLLSALHSGSDPHEVEMHIVSRVTSFGYGLSVKEGEGQYTLIPLLLPIDSGLSILATSDASDAHHNKIAVPACHAGIHLDIKGPIVKCGVEWYQGIEGFTGWHSGNDVAQVWANDPEVEIFHDHPRWSNLHQFRAAMETSTVSSIALNITATRSRLPNGGYGYLGICMDSTASIQMALTGKTTLFPLILGGQVKTCVMLLYKELEAELAAGGHPELASAAAALRLGISNLPTDIVHQPKDTADICGRLLAILPEKSPFALIARSRSKVRKLKAQMEALKADESSNGLLFQRTRSMSFKAA